jgi:hypothetical protein
MSDANPIAITIIAKMQNCESGLGKPLKNANPINALQKKI